MKDDFTSDLKEDNITLWNEILEHPFFEELGNFELPVEKFAYFIEQDYRYLLGFVRCLGIFLSKSSSAEDVMEFEELVEINLNELESLERIYDELGRSKDELESTEPSLATNSYISFLLSQGYRGSRFETYGAILPCDWVFADIGVKLKEKMPEVTEDHHEIYKNWIEEYASEKYQKSVAELRRKVDEKASKAREEEKNTFRDNFETALKYEKSFFDSIYGSDQY